MPRSRPRTKRLVIYLAALLVLFSIAVFAIIPSLAENRLTYEDGTRLTPTPAEVMSAPKEDMALVLDQSAYIVQACCEHSVTSPEAGILRFTVETSDQRVRGSLRSELRFKSTGFDRPTTYRARIKPEAPWNGGDEFVIPMQWHAQRDLWLGEPGRFPPLELAIENQRWVIKKAFDTNRFTMPGDTRVDREVLAEIPFEAGVWSEWQVEARWSADESGTLAIWKDGVLVASDRGPNSYVDAVSPYWKLGTYRPQQAKRGTPAEPISIEFSDIALSIGENRTDDR